MAWAELGVSAVELAANLIGKGQTNKKIDAALASRTPYQTPAEIYKMLNATESKAQGDTITRDYNTTQIDRSFGQTINTATRVGANPNDLAGLFDQKMAGILQVGKEFHASNMEAFGNYLGALKTVGDSKTAEWQSKDNMIKDKLQALTAQKTDQQKGINSAISGILGGGSALGKMNLFKDTSTGGGGGAALQHQ